MSIHNISRREVLGYLKFYQKDVPPDLTALLDRAEAQVRQSATPRTIWREFPLEFRPEGVAMAGTALLLTGGDIRRHLKCCSHGILLAATLGAGMDAAIRAAEVANMAYALVLDATASAGVEAVLDELEAALPAGTRRFSPGYGDLPLALQGAFLQVLDTPRRIGLCVTESLTLLPRKSVTAVIGVRRNL